MNYVHHALIQVDRIIPLIAGLGALLTTHDANAAWTQVTALIFGVSFLRWALTILGVSLGLIFSSWLLYKSLHHREPLHSLVFGIGVAALVGWAFWYYWYAWAWGGWFSAGGRRMNNSDDLFPL